MFGCRSFHWCYCQAALHQVLVCFSQYARYKVLYFSTARWVHVTLNICRRCSSRWPRGDQFQVTYLVEAVEFSFVNVLNSCLISQAAVHFLAVF